MKLIIGLGNPETKYDSTRHNLGFAVLDAFAKEQGATWQYKRKYKADVAEVPSHDALLVKPTTYYNLVGESVKAIADFYKIPAEDILIVHDELALPFGTLRTRHKGSDAGNNGIKSLNAHLGPTTKRLRIGIDNELSAFMEASDFVLAKFTPAERHKLTDAVLPHATAQLQRFLDDAFEPTKISA